MVRVGASVLGLSRVVAPRLDGEGVPAATRDAVIAVASTLGVLVPPSLVLILLSDAMLGAHTAALNTKGRTDRVINTQDLFHAALAPAGILLVFFPGARLFIGRGEGLARPTRLPISGQQIVLAAFTLVALIALLGGVTLGYFFAVEAAAVGAFALLTSRL